MAPLPPTLDKILEYDEDTLSHPSLNDDAIFVKLKDFLKRFTVEADEAIRNETTGDIPEYEYQVSLHKSL